MRAVCWEGTAKIQVETVPDPVILNPRDAIIKVTTTAICGSDLHMYGGYPGGQAEFARVPFADIGPLKVPDNLTDEQVLFLSDIFATGYMAADNCPIKPGYTVAAWG